jgi:trimeric autotransporter adhesin
MATYVNNLRLTELATGEGSGTWGTTTNTNLELIGEALGHGSETIANASTHTITIADGTSDSARSFYLVCAGGGQACTVTLAPNTLNKVWMIENTTSYTLTFSQGSGANVAVAAGQVKMIATNGAGAGAVVYDLLTDVDLTGTTTAVNVSVSGTLGVTGVLTTTATQVATGGITSGSDIISDTDSTDSLGSTGVRWLKGWFDTLTAGTLTIGSGSVTDSSGAISFGDENLTTTGIVTAAGTSVFTNLDISGDIDVDGTTNLDVVDIDGAVDMASTLQVDGAATFSSTVNTNNDVVIAKSSTGVPSLTLSGFAGASSPYSIINFYNSDGSQQGPNNAAQIKALAINSDGSGGSLDFHTSTGTGTEGADATKKVTIGGGGDISFYEDTGTTAKFFWDASAEFLGIGTSSPAHTLDVVGVSRFVGNVDVYSTTGGAVNSSLLYFGSAALPEAGAIYSKTDSATAGNLVLATAESGTGTITERLRIDSSGRVGIGTSSPQTPWITGTASTLSVVSSAKYTGLDIKSYSTSFNHCGAIALGHSKSATINTQAATTTGDFIGSVSFEGVNSSSAVTAGTYISAEQTGVAGATYIPSALKFATSTGSAAAAERMRIDSSGNVGIGTSSPAYALDLTGAMRITGSRSTYIDASEDSSAAAHIFTTDALVGDFNQLAGNLVLQARVTDTVYRDIIFAGGLSTASDLMRITGEGNVGIGTDSPSSALDVVGDIEVSGGVYLGGTVAANLLDDYEEGTWTPTQGNFGTWTSPT